MIVTFHIAIFLAYRIWENYISVLFTNTETTISPDAGDGSGNPNISNSSPVQERPATLNNVANLNSSEESSNRNFLNKTLPVSKSDSSKQAREEDFDLPPVVKLIQTEENEEGRNLIYNVEPNYGSIWGTEEGKGPVFVPPVYIQRYSVVDRVLKLPEWAKSVKKVVDFGCAELSYATRNLKRLTGIEEILAVDTDRYLLENSKNRISPTPTDYLQPRPTPLTVRVLCGSVANTHQVLKNVDAVVAIELIEHLYPHELECLPFTIFGFIKPKIAMFTTPNADFNVLFPNFSGFRHDDHKFEWTREQFEDWAKNLVQRYSDYEVTFKGIGPGPAGTEGLGCCSQMATFVKTCDFQPLPEDELNIQNGPYDVVEEYVYPYFVDSRTRDEVIRDEATHFLNRCTMFRRTYNLNHSDDDEAINSKEIPLKVVMERVKCHSAVKMRSILVKENWEVKKNNVGNEVVILPDSEDEQEDSEEEGEDYHEDNSAVESNGKVMSEEENWDCVEETESTNDKSSLNSTTELISSSDGFSIPEKKETILDRNVLCSNKTDFRSDGGNVSEICVDSSTSDMCRLQEKVLLNCSCGSYSSFNSSPTKVSEVTDSSLYETPTNNEWKIHSYNTKTPTNLSLKSDDKLVNTYNVHLNNASASYISNDVSSFDISTYATPCCSQLHKSKISKCLSLQQINSKSPFFLNEHDVCLNDQTLLQQKDVSKSMEDLQTQEMLDIPKSCSNASCVFDSGYPDSYSGHDMELDLSLQQFDDLNSVIDEDISNSLPSPLAPFPPPPLLRNDVENGDVANNNRDGEGNNLVADMEEEPLEFEGRIEEFYPDVQNFAEVSLDGERSADEDCSSSVATNDSLSKLEFISNQNSSDENKFSSDTQQGNFTLKEHNSLTTVLDGHSKFSNCSLVRPLDKIVDNKEQKEGNNKTPEKFSEWLFKTGEIAQNEVSVNKEDNVTDISKLQVSSASLHPSCSSAKSLSAFRSAESSSSITDDESSETSKFPAWLLGMQVGILDESDQDDYSVINLLANDSFEDFNFEVAVDSRGGGDPQRDTEGNLHLNM